MPTAKQNEVFTKMLLSSYPLDDAVDWIRVNLEPDDVFDEAELEAWAEHNGWQKE